MILHTTLLQLGITPTDTSAAKHIKAASDSVRAHIDSLTNTLTNPDSLANMTPSKMVSGFTDMDWSGIVSNLTGQIITVGLRIAAALICFYIGKFIINKIYRLLQAIMVRKDFDRSLTTFLLSFIKITLLFLLIITAIGIMGIETSSFIAIFASAGVAIGMALSGTLQNFAGGVLILLIKPYKVGDYIYYDKYEGFVREIQIFNTVITTYSNERIVIPNGGLSTGSINNFSAEAYHRLQWKVGISYGDSVDTARRVVLDILKAEPRILQRKEDAVEDLKVPDETLIETANDQEEKKHWWHRVLHWHRKRQVKQLMKQAELIKHETRVAPPVVALESLDSSAVTLVIRAWAKTSDYWDVLYKINEQIYTEFPKQGLHFPFPQMDVHINHAES